MYSAIRTEIKNHQENNYDDTVNYYLYLCAICILYAFDVLYKSSELKKKVF